MHTYADALSDFYCSEVSGEAGYSALVGWARNDNERFTWATLLQLETETKAWLRAPLLALGVSIEERPADRAHGLADARPFMELSWSRQIQTLHDLIASEYVPRYQQYLDAAVARGKPDEQEVCLHMVDHERAQLEFARLELRGASLTDALQPIMRLLKYPLKRGSNGFGLSVQ